MRAKAHKTKTTTDHDVTGLFQARRNNGDPLGEPEDLLDALARARKAGVRGIVVRMRDGAVISTFTPYRYVEAMRQVMEAAKARAEQEAEWC